jgi:hypothetical protein
MYAKVIHWRVGHRACIECVMLRGNDTLDARKPSFEDLELAVHLLLGSFLLVYSSSLTVKDRSQLRKDTLHCMTIHIFFLPDHRASHSSA